MVLGGKRIGLGVFGFGMAALFFGLRAAPGLTFEDSGELAAAAASWGVPHPPGYPLLTMLGGLLMRALAPFGVDPARAMVWLSVVCGALTVGMVTRFVAGRTGARPVAGLLAGGLLCLAPTFAAQALVVEAYALSCAISAALLLAADRGSARWCGLLFGLGLTAHPAGLLNLPLLVFGVLRAGDWKKRWPRTALATGLGLLPMLYVPLAASHTPAVNWGGIHDFGTLMDHLLRRQFGVTPQRDFMTQGTFLAEHVLGQWPLMIVLVVIAGSWKAKTSAAEKAAKAGPESAKHTAQESHGLTSETTSKTNTATVPPTFYRVPLVFSTLLVTTLGLFWAQHWPVGEEITRIRLAGSFAPAVLWMAVLVGLGLARFEGQLAVRFGRRYRLPFLLVGLLFASLHPAPNYDAIGTPSPTYIPGRATLAAFQDMHGVTEADSYARYTLAAAPAGTLLVINRHGFSDVLHFPLIYGQVVLELGPDVTVINREMLGLEWYRRELSARRADLAAPLERMAATLASLPADADPRDRRLASVPFLRDLATRFPGQLALIGRPSPRIAEGLQLTATDAMWWLAPIGTSAPANTIPDAPAAPYLTRDTYPDPWRFELKAMARERDAFRKSE
jgi:hypothetical protein